ncbi:MAG TPA: hypothetical protein VFY14_16630, partial [Streptomyces sp.]|nr:hypothetical protein [Streptomyces sp.]
GTVLEIGLRVTKLRGDDGEIWYVRNGEIKRVGNLSQGWATACLDVEVRSGEDLEEVREAITTAGREMQVAPPWDEFLWAPVEVLGLDSVTLETMVVRVSVKTIPGKALPVERELRWRIKRELDARGIRMVDEESLVTLRKLEGDLGRGPGGEPERDPPGGTVGGTTKGAPGDAVRNVVKGPAKAVRKDTLKDAAKGVHPDAARSTVRRQPTP